MSYRRDDGISSAGRGAVDTPAAAREPDSIADVLRLLSAGVPVAILLALDDGPLRTKILTQRVRGYTPRTIYRHIPRLVERRLVDRDEATGSRSGVLHSLTRGPGRDLCSLIKRFAAVSQTQVSAGQVEVQAWAPLGVLADLWEAGVIGKLSRGSRSSTELAQGVNGLSYHQVIRRAGVINTAGFLRETTHLAGKRRCYALTDKAQRTMGLIAGIARWRDRHVVAGGGGMTLHETMTLLRASLPLVRLRPREKRLILRVVSGDYAGEIVAEVDRDGKVSNGSTPDSGAASWVEGNVRAWCEAVLEGRIDGFRGDDGRLVADFIGGLHAALWTPGPFPPLGIASGPGSRPAEDVRGDPANPPRGPRRHRGPDGFARASERKPF